MPDFQIIPIIHENCMDVWDVYKSNNDYFLAAYEKNVEPSNIFQTWERLVDDYDASQQLFFGLWQNGAPIAVVELLPHFPKQNQLWLSEIIVHQNAKNKGLGTKITQAIISAAKTEKFTKIQLGVGEENPKAQQFWQKMGFVPVEN